MNNIACWTWPILIDCYNTDLFSDIITWRASKMGDIVSIASGLQHNKVQHKSVIKNKVTSKRLCYLLLRKKHMCKIEGDERTLDVFFCIIYFDRYMYLERFSWVKNVSSLPYCHPLSFCIQVEGAGSKCFYIVIL